MNNEIQSDNEVLYNEVLYNEVLDNEVLYNEVQNDEVLDNDTGDAFKYCSVNEYNYVSKIKTEESLIALGRELARKQLIEEANNQLKGKLIDFIEPYDGVRYRLINLKFRNTLFRYMEVMEEKLDRANKEIENINKDYDILIQESDDTFLEFEKLEKHIKDYWEPRVIKLRTNIIQKNKTIDRLIALVYVLSFILIILLVSL